MTSNDLAGIIERERARADKLATTLDSLGDGVISTGLDGLIEQMNPVAESITGWSFAEAQGRSAETVLCLVDGATRLAVENPFAHAMRARRPVALPKGTRVVRRDKIEVPIADTCTPVRDAAGVVTGAVMVFRDLSSQAQAEARAAKEQRELALQEQTAALEALAARVAHEINNPLCYVTANVHAAIDEVRALGGDAMTQRMRDLETTLAEALEGVTRVARIVRGLRPLSEDPDAGLAASAALPMLPGSVKILVVDDEPSIGHAIRRVLSEYAVSSVTSGRSALELLARGDTFDVIVSDLMMADMSGVALYRKVLELDPAAARRIVFISGGAWSKDTAAFLFESGNMLLEKPFSPAALRAAVETVAAARRLA